jgi:hypothetical protein
VERDITPGQFLDAMIKACKPQGIDLGGFALEKGAVGVQMQVGRVVYTYWVTPQEFFSYAGTLDELAAYIADRGRATIEHYFKEAREKERHGNPDLN